MLYFDPRLSASHAISCSPCHSIGFGGADAEPTTDACDPPETFGQHPTLQ
ncbi:cytochrome c peroxidase [Bradyrhizobium sp. A5]